MSLTANVQLIDSNGRNENLPCSECGRVTSHVVLTIISSSDESPGGEIQVWDDYLIVQCSGCKIVTFAQISTNSEDFDYDEFGDMHPSQTRRVYPGRIVGRSEMPQAFQLPHSIYQIYKETHSALCNDLPILAGVGIRAIVEAVCSDQNAQGGNLQQRIDSLAQMNLITGDAATILQSLRFMGNAAVHEMRAHSSEELYTAFEVAEYLLQGVYVIPSQASSLPQQGT